MEGKEKLIYPWFMNSIYLISGGLLYPEDSCKTAVARVAPVKSPAMRFQEIFLRLPHADAYKLQESPRGESLSLKQLTLVHAAASAFIDAVSFIPSNLRESQILFARRTKSKDQRGFILPEDFFRGNLQNYKHFRVENEEQIVTTTCQIDASFVQTIRKILSLFLKDRKTTAIALTFRSLHGPTTCIWSKKLRSQDSE